MGGVVYTPYLPAQAGSSQASATTSSGGTSSSSSPEKISGTIKKEIIDLLKANGMPSDVSKLIDVANGFLLKSKVLSNYSIFGGEDEDYDLSDLMKVQQLVNDVKYNNDLRNEAVKQITKEAAGSEVAINSKGQMYVMTKDGIKLVDPEDYEGGALTNDELLYYREQHPDLAFETSILNDLQNTIGMKSITDYLRTTINAFGKEEIGSYTTKDEAVNRGLAALASGPDGFYKLKTSTQFKESDINAALDFLYNGLSKNAQQLLVATTAVEGGNPKSIVDTRRLILQALHFYPDNSIDVDFDKTATEYDPLQTGKKGGSGSETKVQNTYLYRIASLNGPRQTVMLAPRGSKIADTGLMVSTGIVNGAVVDKDEKRLGPMSLTHMLQSAEAVKAADASTITLGNRLLKDSEYGAVMFDGNTECNTVFLPYTTENGRIVPDFELFEKFNELQRRISGKFNVPKTEIDRIANEIGLNSSEYNYDSATNSCTLKRTMPFLSFGVIVGDDSIQLSKDDKRFLEKIDKQDAKSYEKAYNNMLIYGKADRKRSDLKVGDYKKSEANDFYRGLIWMAMPDAYRGAHLSMDEYIPRDIVNNFGRRTELRQEQVDAYNMYQDNYGNFASLDYEQ